MADKFKINEYGEVIREGQTNIEISDIEIAEKEEIFSLKMDVFRHPEHYSEQELSEKKKRLDELWKKYELESEEVALLEYSVFVHPERCSEQELDRRKKRLDVLWEKYGKNDNTVISLKKAKMKVELLDKKKSSDGNSLLKNAILNLKKSKDTGL